MEFSEYEKMKDSLNSFDQSSITKELKDVNWAVTEKIHGANFSFHTDGVEVKPARRRDFLKDENFYNYLSASFMEDCPEKIKTLFPIVQDIVGEKITQISVYGELYGGVYLHPDVKKRTKKIKPVQGEVQYSPDMQFTAFDISYRKEMQEEKEEEDDDCDTQQHEYIDFEKSLELFDQLGIPCVKPLYIGAANVALNYELGFDSHIPKQLGLPPLPEGTNKAEGIVIRPMKELMCITRRKTKERVMVKLKIPEFDERRDQTGKIVQQRENQQKVKKDNNKKNLVRPDKILLPRFVGMVTENRLVSAISKVGQPDSEETESAVLEEMFQDILNDAFEGSGENETLWTSLDTKRKDTISKSIRAKITAQIHRYNNEKKNYEDTR